MGKKVKITLYMDQKIVVKAKEIGFNISKLCENCLKRAIYALESTFQSNNPDKGGKGTVGSSMEPRAGFEPATSSLPRRYPNQLGHRGMLVS